ncbi:MAG: YdbH domain-containing protein [Pseudomonadales bacterium]
MSLGRHLVRGLTVLGGLLAGLLLAGYAAWPWLIVLLSPWLATAVGGDQLRVAVSRPGFSALTVASLELQRGGLHVQARQGELRYRLFDLLAGRLQSVTFDQLTLQVVAGNATGSGSAVIPPSSAIQPSSADLQRLFARLPAERLQVGLLQLEVPALEFRARGHLLLTPAALDARLEAIAPARARGLELAVRLTSAALLDLQLGDGGDPFLRVGSALGADRVDINADLDLNDFALELAVELAGLPPGQGSVAGGLAASLPWPLPDGLGWGAVTASGGLRADWQPIDGQYALSDASVQWQLDGAVVSAAGSARARYAGQAFALQAAVERFHLGGGDARGSIELSPLGLVAAAAPETAGAPLLAAELTLAEAELLVDADFDLRGEVLELAQALAGAPPGHGALAGRLSMTLPWPLRLPLDVSALAAGGGLRAAGSVRGSWAWEQQQVALHDLAGDWHFADGHLAGEWRGDLRSGALRAPLRLALQPMDPTAVLLAATGELAVTGLGSAPFALTHDLQTGAGALRAEAALVIAAPLAAGLTSRWAHPYDLTAGRLGIAADLHWTQPTRPSGTLAISMEEVGGHYWDYLAEGMQGLLQFTAKDGDWALLSSPLGARAVEVGFTVGQVESRLAWAGDTVSVHAASATLLGGRARVPAFDYRIGTGEARFTVALENLDLAEILALEGEQVVGSGRLDANLPVTLVANAVSIRGGSVRAHAPGGRLQVSPALAAGAGQPGLDFALRALQNFDYVMLQGDVSYTEQGDLAFGVQLQGRNPDVEGGRPIRYNLTVTENLPLLLQSLRLQDQVTRGLQRRLERKPEKH